MKMRNEEERTCTKMSVGVENQLFNNYALELAGKYTIYFRVHSLNEI